MLPAIGRSNQEIFFELLNGASLFFFAGSGISYASGIPSAYTFLKTATSAIFPGLSDKELEILSGVQPEIFYESLLAYVPSEVALQPWMALHPNVASRFGSPPKPNLVHFELVRYSSTNSIPIFTTNFDTLFEDAAAILGLHCTVLLPDALPKFPSTGATICKLHGSISDNCGRPSIDNLYTTMSAITRSNNTWIEALTRLMDRKHICFVGYSGRDLDLFPFIESYTKRSTTREPIWINQTFFNDPSEGPSVRCGAIRLSGLFPYDLFKEIGAVEPSVSAVTQTNFIIGKKGTELALTSLACDFATKSKLTIVDRETLRIQLHAKLGRYSFAHDLLQSDSSIMLGGNSATHLLAARLCHERSLYIASARNALQAIKRASGSKVPPPLSSVIIGLTLFAESHRMRVPYDTYFDSSTSMRWLQSAVTFLLLVAVWLILVPIQRYLSRRLTIEAIHEILEHRIRLLSVVQAFIVDPMMGKCTAPINWLRRRWEMLRTNCYNNGYAFGIANCQKFAERLECSSTSNFANDVYTLLTSSTGIELLMRNKANLYLRSGEFQAAEHAFAEMAETSKRSGNRLNEIKSILGMAYARSKQQKTPRISELELTKFDELTSKLDAKTLISHLQSIRAKYLI